ncbi:MAG: type II toxin-antitoxin system VapB family antitoxin [bacterium]
MPLNIKNEKVHEQARNLARLTGQSISEAVADAVAEKLERERRRRGAATAREIEMLDDIARECARLPVNDDRTADEILGYNDAGMPS